MAPPRRAGDRRALRPRLPGCPAFRQFSCISWLFKIGVPFVRLPCSCQLRLGASRGVGALVLQLSAKRRSANVASLVCSAAICACNLRSPLRLALAAVDGLLLPSASACSRASWPAGRSRSDRAGADIDVHQVDALVGQQELADLVGVRHAAGLEDVEQRGCARRRLRSCAAAARCPSARRCRPRSAPGALPPAVRLVKSAVICWLFRKSISRVSIALTSVLVADRRAGW